MVAATNALVPTGEVASIAGSGATGGGASALASALALPSVPSTTTVGENPTLFSYDSRTQGTPSEQKAGIGSSAWCMTAIVVQDR